MRIKLENAFGNCHFPNKCNCLINNSFESVSHPIFFLFDGNEPNQGPVRIVYDQKKFQLTVNNTRLKEICLTKLDKCLIPNDISKCECLLFDDSKLFFVEIKSSNAGSRGNKRKKAREQLANTIRLLLKRGLDFDNYLAKAIICFKSTEPRITNSAINTSKAEFFREFKIALEERNYIDF